MEGCGIVMYTASPFTTAVDDPERELIEPARKGTRNLLEQASTTPTVRRIVVTSSCAAIYGDKAPGVPAGAGRGAHDGKTPRGAKRPAA